MLAGGAGAVIGGTTGKKNTTYLQKSDVVTHGYTVLVTTKNISKPLISIPVGDNGVLANEILATFKAIIASNYIFHQSQSAWGRGLLAD